MTAVTGYERVRQALADRHATRKGPNWQCPAHEDHNPSLTVHEGNDGAALIHCQAGCSAEDIVRGLGLTMSDLFTENGNGSREEVATYDYTDETGELLFQAVRFYPKGFAQRRPDGNGGWVWKLGNVRRVPYRLPQILEAVKDGRTVYITEGEKDVHAIEEAGGVATCNPMGAGKWRDEFASYFADASVIVVADKDEVGRAHASDVMRSIVGVSSDALLVEAGADRHDAAEHLAAGLALHEFVPVTDEPDGLPSPADLAGLLSRPQVPPRFAIPGVAPRGQVTIIYGGIGSGKSSLYQDAIVSNETGRLFVGLREFEEPQMFSVFDWENGDGERTGMGAPQMLRRLGMPATPPLRVRYYFDSRDFNLDTETGSANVRKVLVRDKATCVIFDSRDFAFPNTDENDGRGALNAMQAALDLARELDIAVVLISHEPKAEYSDSASKLRGHTAWGQLAEQMFRYVRRGDARLLEHTKHRGLNQRPSLAIQLTAEGGDMDPIYLQAQEAATAEDRAQQRAEDVAALEGYLQAHGPVSRKVMEATMSSAGMGSGRLRSAIDALQTSGRLLHESYGPYAVRSAGENAGGQLAAI